MLPPCGPNFPHPAHFNEDIGGKCHHRGNVVRENRGGRLVVVLMLIDQLTASIVCHGSILPAMCILCHCQSNNIDITLESVDLLFRVSGSSKISSLCPRGPRRWIGFRDHAHPNNSFLGSSISPEMTTRGHMERPSAFFSILPMCTSDLDILCTKLCKINYGLCSSCLAPPRRGQNAQQTAIASSPRQAIPDRARP